jgi:hypothetical protein
VYSSAALFVQLNMGEINYQDKQEVWGNSEKHMKFWHKKLYRKDKLGNTCEDIRVMLKSNLQEVDVLLVD